MLFRCHYLFTSCFNQMIREIITSFWNEKQFSLNNIKKHDSMKYLVKNWKKKSCRFRLNFTQESKILKVKKRNTLSWNLRKVKEKFKLQDIYMRRLLKTVKTIDIETRCFATKHRAKKLTQISWRHWEKGCKSTKIRPPDEFQKKVEISKKIGWLKKQIKNY